MTLNPRQRSLLDAVRLKGTISVDELALQLNVTPQTVRRDVKQMEAARLLARYHGGVGLPSSVKNIDYSQRQVMNSDAKRRIARDGAGGAGGAASQQIQGGGQAGGRGIPPVRSLWADGCE